MDIATGFDYRTKCVGVGGGLLGLIAYLNSRQMKAIEWRVQLRTRRHDFSQLLDQVGPLMASALQSRRNVNSAIGLSQSGQEKLFIDEHAQDVNLLTTVSNEKSKPAPNYRKLSFVELEAHLVDLHAMLSRTESLRSKYKATVAAHDTTREYIHDDMMANIARRMVGRSHE